MYTVIDTTDDSLSGALYPSKRAARDAATGDTEEVVELTTSIETDFPDAIVEGLAQGANTGALRRGDTLEDTVAHLHPHLQQVVFDEFVVPLLIAYSEVEQTDARNEAAVAAAADLLDALPDRYDLPAAHA